MVGPDESNCDLGTEPECSIDVPVRALEIVKTAEPIAVQPGGTVTYTVEVTNIGQVPYTAGNPASRLDVARRLWGGRKQQQGRREDGLGRKSDATPVGLGAV